ncbi:NERD domain-containing protein [Alkalihalobacillus sp. MEB130]|uniref:nuclease-related domain-containing protein n=1 Tax=Alkalihalobacillus sp. MEB130 TaxID=2976704 RepID=UPI0028DFBD2F|nr:nuclease-related domain-containing protein [Alkalihalobacillus sp. MEB130]MDT8862129.1 NERD domain-containing protein [Alkalihalobacillus sp. MEB130]
MEVRSFLFSLNKNEKVKGSIMGFIYFIIVVGLIIFVPYKKFRDSKYEEASGNGFFATLFDKGNYGEYLTFSLLKNISIHKRLMTNLYIPNKDGKITEIDLLLITETGLYVFESKNYSGWIFGDERYKNWTQTFPNKHKNQFFNPIWQNKGHINALKQKLELTENDLYKSYIIFSERCTLKKVQIHSPEVKVLKRNELAKTINIDIKSSSKILTPSQVDQIYVRLNKYTKVDDIIKKVHIDQIKNRKKSGA